MKEAATPLNHVSLHLADIGEDVGVKGVGPEEPTIHFGVQLCELWTAVVESARDPSLLPVNLPLL